MAERITEEQVRVYSLMTNVIARFLLVLLASGVLIAVTAKLIIDPGWPIAAAEGVLSHTVYRVFKHYFPTNGTHD